MHCHRYWGEDSTEPKNALTLEGLHQLAEHRARERASKKRQLGSEELCNGSQEGSKYVRLKHAKLSNSGSRKSGKKTSKTESESKLETDKHYSVGSSDSESDALMDSDDRLSSDGGVSCGEDGEKRMSGIELEEGEEEGEDVDSSRAAAVEGEEAVDEPASLADKPADSASGGDDATPTLAPLGRSKPGGPAGKKIVHRQLPEWILNFDVIENDIEKYSE